MSPFFLLNLATELQRLRANRLGARRGPCGERVIEQRERLVTLPRVLLQPRHVPQRQCDIRPFPESPEDVKALFVQLKRRFVLTLERMRVGEVRPRVRGAQIVADTIPDRHGFFGVLRCAVEPPPRHFELAEIVQRERAGRFISQRAHDVQFLSIQSFRLIVLTEAMADHGDIVERDSARRRLAAVLRERQNLLVNAERVSGLSLLDVDEREVVERAEMRLLRGRWIVDVERFLEEPNRLVEAARLAVLVRQGVDDDAEMTRSPIARRPCVVETLHKVERAGGLADRLKEIGEHQHVAVEPFGRGPRARVMRHFLCALPPNLLDGTGVETGGARSGVGQQRLRKLGEPAADQPHRTRPRG